jgi:hypothetical protein
MEMRRKLKEKGREHRLSQLVSRLCKMSLTSPFEKKSSRKQSSRTKITCAQKYWHEQIIRINSYMSFEKNTADCDKWYK